MLLVPHLALQKIDNDMTTSHVDDNDIVSDSEGKSEKNLIFMRLFQKQS